MRFFLSRWFKWIRAVRKKAFCNYYSAVTDYTTVQLALLIIISFVGVNTVNRMLLLKIIPNLYLKKLLLWITNFDGLARYHSYRWCTVNSVTEKAVSLLVILERMLIFFPRKIAPLNSKFCGNTESLTALLERTLTISAVWLTAYSQINSNNFATFWINLNWAWRFPREPEGAAVIIPLKQ